MLIMQYDNNGMPFLIYGISIFRGMCVHIYSAMQPLFDLRSTFPTLEIQSRIPGLNVQPHVFRAILY